METDCDIVINYSTVIEVSIEDQSVANKWETSFSEEMNHFQWSRKKASSREKVRTMRKVIGFEAP